MATITSKVITGNFATGTNWIGDIAPASKDTVIIVSGAVITIESDTPDLGSNISDVGVGVTVKSGAVLLVGATLKVNGYNNTTGAAIKIETGGTLQRISGGNLTITPTGSVWTRVDNLGDFLWDGGTIESGESFTTVDAGQTLSEAVAIGYETFFGGSYKAIQLLYLGVGVISNSAETGVGTPLDNSFTVVSVTGNGSTTPAFVFQNKVASYQMLLSRGDYYVDCEKCLAFYYIDEGESSRLTMTYTVKVHRWLGFEIASYYNGNSRCKIENATLRRMGRCQSSSRAELEHQSILMLYRTNGVVNPNREGYVRNCIFEYCYTPLNIYYSTNTEANPIDFTGNSYLGCVAAAGNFHGLICLGYFQYGDFSRAEYRGPNYAFGGMRAPQRGIVSRNCFGETLVPPIIGQGSTVEDCDFLGFGNLFDTTTIQTPGNATYGVNTYKRLKVTFGCRVGRIGSYMTLEDSEFSQHHHHGIIAPASNGFYSSIRVKNNTIGDCALSGNMGGGWTLGYNYTQWIDDVEIENNTFDTGARTICFNDQEGTKVLGTRLKIWNNNCTNSGSGIVHPENSATNQTKKQLLRLDYNNDYNNITASNVRQCTPTKSGVEFNIDPTRACNGVAIFAASVDNAVGKTLELVVSGTPGTDLSMLLSWGGGAAVQLVAAQGVATSGTAATSHTTPATITDTTKSWTADSLRLNQGTVVSGTGAGQFFMIRTNNGTTLTVMPNTDTGAFTAVSVDSVYIVLWSEVALSDGTQDVQAGIFIVDLPLTVGTYTDTGIVFTSNAVAINPDYKNNRRLVPSNLLLGGAGFGGIKIGAHEPIGASAMVMGM